jgi:PAS domain S-box-containing protein
VLSEEQAPGRAKPGDGGIPGEPSMRWEWHLVADQVRCTSGAVHALACTAAGVASFDEWIALVDPRERRRVEEGLRGCAGRHDGFWRGRYRLSSGGELPILVEHDAYAVGSTGASPWMVIGSVRAIGDCDDAGLRCLSPVLDYADDAILVRDMDHRILYWNRAAAVRYGWSANEVVGASVRCTIYRATPEEQFASAMRTVLRLGAFAGRMMHRRRDGGTLAVHSHWILVRDTMGAPRFILSISTDVDARVDLEERLAQAQKLAALGGLAGGIAHDFNNLLTVIIGNAEELGEGLQGQGELAELALMIRSAGLRGAQLTRRLLGFARSRALQPELLDVAATLEGIAPLLRRSLRENIVFTLDSATGGACVFADRGQFESAILNLCINARDAMPAGGELAIRAAMASMSAEKARRAGLQQGGDYLVLTVSDDGVGISPAVLEQVFDPFFTTKAGGSGLGLTMVKEFAHQSNGHVEISSRPGCGSVVSMYLPRAPGGPRFPLLSAPAGSPVVHAVLLVEDDPDLRTHVRKLLEALGNVVTAAASGEEALSLLSSGLDCDVLLSDIVLPGMSGMALAHEARRMRSDLRVLLSTGYALDSAECAEELRAGGALLRKPYGKEELRRVLASLDPVPVDAGVAPGATRRRESADICEYRGGMESRGGIESKRKSSWNR